MWTPQGGVQTAAILTGQFIDELLYGGARGGGKSDFLLGDFGQDVGKGHNAEWRGILFRRSYPELEELVRRSREIYPRWFPGAEYKEQIKTWNFPDGATLRLRFLEREADADLYQGHSYTWIGWDELSNWPNLAAYRKLKATLRSAAKIDCKRIRASANPGGPSHAEIKEYFAIDRHPHGSEVIADPEGITRMFIRARVQDNAILMDADPHYVARLKGTGSAELVRAWLEGDWDAVLGAYFDCWRADKHVIAPFSVPSHWLKFRSFDWGSARPFSVGWWTVASEEREGIPQGALVRYREWYGAAEPNVGLRLTVEEVAAGIVERSHEDVAYSVADPAIFASDGGPSMAERFLKSGVLFKPADNKRIPTLGHVGGWDQMRQRMVGEDLPMIYCFDTCRDSIRTIPSLQHDTARPEDLDSSGEDHAADEWRYACMSRPYTKPSPTRRQKVKGLEAQTWDDLFEEHRKSQREERVRI